METGTIRIVFYGKGKEIFHREYNYATPQSIMDEFRWISFLDGFKTPNGEPFEMAICYWKSDGFVDFHSQWTLVIN